MLSFLIYLKTGAFEIFSNVFLDPSETLYLKLKASAIIVFLLISDFERGLKQTALHNGLFSISYSITLFILLLLFYVSFLICFSFPFLSFLFHIFLFHFTSFASLMNKMPTWQWYPPTPVQVIPLRLFFVSSLPSLTILKMPRYYHFLLFHY